MESPVFKASDKVRIRCTQEDNGEKRSKLPVDARVVFFAAPQSARQARWLDALTSLPASDRNLLEKFAKRRQWEPKAGEQLVVDAGPELRWVLSVLPEPQEPFFFLENARHAVSALQEAKCRHAVVDLRLCSEHAQVLAEAFVSAQAVACFEPKVYTETGKGKQKEKEKPKPPDAWPELHFLASTELPLESLNAAASTGEATNCVRYLSGLPSNELTPTHYLRIIRDYAKGLGLQTEVFAMDRLKKMGAGAFAAVARASQDKHCGVVRVRYRPAQAKKKVALVGKGITFDTGGNQLKTGDSMFGMHGDMGGSAVVLALVLLAAKQKWPWEVDAYLAIAENLTDALSYRPNDVVRAMNGKTIEVVDADAEGRMVLADTLVLASRNKPHLILDFATLTGACVRAIGTNYSGVYTNQPQWWSALIEAGRRSGERVWPFPADPDYGRALKSDTATLKQCRVSGGSDHIEAGYFLSQFVDATTPWVHVDLSAAEVDDGLAHVGGKLTGFGVRFAREFLHRHFMPGK